MQPIILLLLACLSSIVNAGESSSTTTFQPLNGLEAGGIQIVQVTCWDWYSHSGQPTAIRLITVPNIPPTNAPKPVGNWNLASLCGLDFRLGDFQDNSSVTLDASQFDEAKLEGFPKDQVVRATLECLRRVLPEKHQEITVLLIASEVDKSWLNPILAEFNQVDRKKPFFVWKG